LWRRTEAGCFCPRDLRLNDLDLSVEAFDKKPLTCCYIEA
jgi:hypothetical protein